MMKTPEEIKKGFVEAIEEASWVVEGGDAHDLIDAVEKAHASMADGLACIEQLEAQVPKWISVEEALPEKGQTVMVCGVRNGMQVGAFRETLRAADNRVWCWKKDNFLVVTHWMPLPEPPKEG